IRLLAIKEGISQTSTLDRLNQLMNLNGNYYEVLSGCKNNFLRLLELRLTLFNQSDSYDDIHYLKINKLTREEKKELKQILKEGKKLHQYVNAIIEKGC
ncbi:MAG: putative nucleotidyltransferase substrate binding domain-containing protein, partial [Bacillus sp. (in: firmicutes)]